MHICVSRTCICCMHTLSVLKELQCNVPFDSYSRTSKLGSLMKELAEHHHFVPLHVVYCHSKGSLATQSFSINLMETWA